jgi:RsiW-degrading membrane proteinase PrsW (M82 family)
MVFQKIIPIQPDIESMDFFKRLFQQTLLVGSIEELVKIIPVFIAIFLSLKISKIRVEDPLDTIIIASSSAIGFIVLETIFLYCNPVKVTTDYQAWTALQLLIPRIFISIGGHIAYSGFFGYFIGVGLQHRSRFWLLCAAGYIVAGASHGLWNAIVPFGIVYMIMAACAAYFLFITAIYRARLSSKSALRHTEYKPVEK